MFKWGLEKAEEPEIKLLTFAGSYRKQGTGRRVEGLGVVANHEGGVGARLAKD